MAKINELGYEKEWTNTPQKNPYAKVKTRKFQYAKPNPVGGFLNKRDTYSRKNRILRDLEQHQGDDYDTDSTND
jgi:hypothetical protein